MTFSPDNLYAAAEKAVALLCEQSKHPGDEFDRAAMELGAQADLITMVDPVAAEREACAKIAETTTLKPGVLYKPIDIAPAVSLHIAAAIRARGQTT